MSIDSLGLSIKNEKQKESTTETVECIDIGSDQTKMDTNKIGQDVNEKVKYVFGHDSNDQHLFPMDKQHPFLLQSHLRAMQEFDGYGDAEQWLKYILEKFDLLELTTAERNNLVPEILTVEATIWYVKQQDDMPTFTLFMKKYLQYYGQKELSQEPVLSFTSEL